MWEQGVLQGKKKAEDQLAIQAKNLLFDNALSKDFIFKSNMIKFKFYEKNKGSRIVNKIPTKTGNKIAVGNLFYL